MARKEKAQPEPDKPAFVVTAVARDENAHCVIRVDITTHHTFFVENNGAEFVISKMRTADFNHRFAVMPDYDVKRAARTYLNNAYTPFTSAARQQLNRILEDTMSEPRTFRAPSTTPVAAKAQPKKDEPKAQPKTASNPTNPATNPKKETTVAEKSEKKTAKKPAAKAQSKKAEPKAAAKKAPAKVPAKAQSKKAEPKAAAKKAPAKKAESTGREDRSIKSTGKVNECREGSFCYAQVKALQSSKTVSEAQAKLDKSGFNPNERRIEVAWAEKQGYIKVL